MSQNQIQVPANRLAHSELAFQTAEVEAIAADEHLAALIARRGAFAKEIHTIRGNRPASALTDAEGIRVYLLSLDLQEIEPMIDCAWNKRMYARTKAYGENPVHGTAPWDFQMATNPFDDQAIKGV